MELLKNTDLKRSLFITTFFGLMIGCILAVVSFFFMESAYQHFYNPVVNMNFEKDINNGHVTIEDTEDAGTVSPDSLLGQSLDFFLVIVPIIFLILSIIVANISFYRWKLKIPIEELKNGANRIIDNDLQFAVTWQSKDELGQVCFAFEKMRRVVENNIEELLHDKEEQKKLTAAFSHDLKNPITIIKGELAIVSKRIELEQMNKDSFNESLLVVNKNLDRIERRIDAMNQTIKMELISVTKEPIEYTRLCKEYRQHLEFVLEGLEESWYLDCDGNDERFLNIDLDVFYNVVDNVVLNSARYGRNINVEMGLIENMLHISIQDDGPGYSEYIIQNGMEPFTRDQNDYSNHFGLGLYICNILCKKHGGSFSIANNSVGAICEILFEVN